jgi:hypothetical protein
VDPEIWKKVGFKMIFVGGFTNPSIWFADNLGYIKYLVGGGPGVKPYRPPILKFSCNNTIKYIF